jgi:beta-galactosidase
VPATADLAGYRMVVAPSLAFTDEALATRLAASEAELVLGPRSGSKTPEFAIPSDLAPGAFRTLLPLTVARVESLRPGLEHRGDGFTVRRWLEEVESDLAPEDALEDGRGVVWHHGRARYIAAWPDAPLLARVLRRAAADAGLAATDVPEDLGLRSAGNLRFAFNYGPEPIDLAAVLGPLDLVLGEAVVPPSGVAAWKATTA